MRSESKARSKDLVLMVVILLMEFQYVLEVDKDYHNI